MRVKTVGYFLLTAGVMTAVAWAQALTYYPEPTPTPFTERDTPYSVVIFRPPENHQICRMMLESIRDMGVTRPFASALWWQMDTMGGDYWKKMGYAPGTLGKPVRSGFENYIKVCDELGMTACIRVGTFRSTNGLFHPMDPTGDVNNYAAWLKEFAAKYRGKIEHYIIGDEMNKSFPQWNWRGTPEEYMKIFVPLAEAIHAGDPQAHVTPASTSSSPATDWVMGLIELGLPQHADGVACHFNYRRIEDHHIEIADFMQQVRAAWPDAKFYGNGFGYADHRELHDAKQAAIVSQCAFTMWDIGWDSFPYYTYRFSRTADTKQNLGLMNPATRDKPAVFSDAWYAYQTIAQTFYDRDVLKAPDCSITLQQAQTIDTVDGVTFTIAAPDPVLRVFNRRDRQLLIYLAYRNFREPRQGTFNIIVAGDQWGLPAEIPLLDYRSRKALPHHEQDGKLVIENVNVSMSPTIITLQRRK